MKTTRFLEYFRRQEVSPSRRFAVSRFLLTRHPPSTITYQLRFTVRHLDCRYGLRGGSQMKMRLSGLEEIERWILNSGTHANVLRPAVLATHIRDITTVVAKRYAS